MSKRVLIAMTCILGLSMLAGCIGPKPVFDECGGNNCRKGRDVQEARITANPANPHILPAH